MKLINKTLAVGLLLSVGACDLTEEPYGFYSEDNFYQSVDDAEAAIAYAYDALTYLEYSRGVFLLGDLPTDECGPKADEGQDAQDLNSWNVQNFQTNRTLMNYFKYAYLTINRCNAVLKAIPDADFEQVVKDKYLGEAYFLRAWNYFNLVRNFGIVPMHTELVETLNQTSAPYAENLDEVYNLIISDCRKAESLLTVNQALGRADKVAAQSLAAKVYLHMASSKENNVPLYGTLAKDVNTLYDSAAYFAGSVINGQSTYGFDDDLLNIYDVEEYAGPEHIFIMSMDRTGQDEGDYSKISKLFIPYVGSTIYMSDGDGTYTHSHDGWSVFQTRETFYGDFDGADLRGTLLLVNEIYNEEGEVIGSVADGSLPYRFSRKYVDPDFIGDKTSTRPFLIRYSDIALVYAEASGPTSEGYQMVNYIRNRAGLGDLIPGLSATDFRDAVLAERSKELIYEGNRLYDLRRFNRVNDLVEEAAGLTDEEVAYYPIPQIEIDLNSGLD